MIELKPCYKCGGLADIVIKSELSEKLLKSNGQLKPAVCVICQKCGKILYIEFPDNNIKDYCYLCSEEFKAKVIANYNTIYDKSFSCQLCQDIDVKAGDELRLYTQTDCDGGYIVETVYANYCPMCGRNLKGDRNGLIQGNGYL